MAREDEIRLAESFKSFFGQNEKPSGGDYPFRMVNPIVPDYVIPFDPEEVFSRVRAGKTLNYVFEDQIEDPDDIAHGAEGHRVPVGIDSTGAIKFRRYYYLDELTDDGRTAVFARVEHAYHNAQSLERDEPESDLTVASINEALSDVVGGTLPPVLKSALPSATSEPVGEFVPSDAPSSEIHFGDDPGLLRLKNPMHPEIILPETQETVVERFHRGYSLDFVFLDEISESDLMPMAPKGAVRFGPDAGRLYVFMDDLKPEVAARIYRNAYRSADEAARKTLVDLTLDEMTAKAGKKIAEDMTGGTSRVDPLDEVKIEEIAEKTPELSVRIAEGLTALKDRTLFELGEAKRKVGPKLFMAGFALTVGSLVVQAGHALMTKDPTSVMNGLSHAMASIPRPTFFQRITETMSDYAHEAFGYVSDTARNFSGKFGEGLREFAKGFETPPVDTAVVHGGTVVPHEAVAATVVHPHFVAHGGDAPPHLPAHPHHHPSHVSAPESPSHPEKNPVEPFHEIARHHQQNVASILSRDQAATSHELLKEQSSLHHTVSEAKDEMNASSSIDGPSDYAEAKDEINHRYEEAREAIDLRSSHASEHIKTIEGHALDANTSETAKAYAHESEVRAQGLPGDASEAQTLDMHHRSETAIGEIGDSALSASDHAREEALKTLSEEHQQALDTLSREAQHLAANEIDENYDNGPGM